MSLASLAGCPPTLARPRAATAPTTRGPTTATACPSAPRVFSHISRASRTNARPPLATRTSAIANEGEVSTSEASGSETPMAAMGTEARAVEMTDMVGTIRRYPPWRPTHVNSDFSRYLAPYNVASILRHPNLPSPLPYVLHVTDTHLNPRCSS